MRKNEKIKSKKKDTQTGEKKVEKKEKRAQRGSTKKTRDGYKHWFLHKNCQEKS